MSVLIIAEAGVNHNGSLARAKKMALAAKTAGADIVKYQTAVPELVVSKFAEKAEYQKAQTGAGESQLEMVRHIHFGFDGHRELKAYCEEIGIAGAARIQDPFRRDHEPALSGTDRRAEKTGHPLHRHEHAGGN